MRAALCVGMITLLLNLSWTQRIDWVSRNLYQGLAEARFPTVNADATRIAFQVDRPGMPSEIWLAVLVDGQYILQQVSAGSPPLPAVGSHPAISLDGRTVVFQTPQGYQIGIWQDHPSGLVIQTIVPAYRDLKPPFVSPTVSGDGQHIAFVGRIGGTWQVFVYDRLTEKTVLISFRGSKSLEGIVQRVPASFPCVSPTMSGNGRFVAFMSHDLGVLDENGDGESDRPPQHVPWFVALHDRDADGNGIFDEALPDGTRTVPILPPPGGVALAPSLSSDGAFLAFASVSPTPPTQYYQDVCDLWVMRIQDGISLKVTQMLLPSGSVQSGTTGQGYSDWIGKPILVTSPQDPAVVFLALHSYDPGLVHPTLQRPSVRGVGQVYIARCDFRHNQVSFWPVVQQPISVDFPRIDDDRDGLADEDPINGSDDDRDGRIDEDPPESLPMAPSLFPVLSLIHPSPRGNEFSIVFHTLAPLARDNPGAPVRDTNGRWDIYLSRLVLP